MDKKQKELIERLKLKEIKPEKKYNDKGKLIYKKYSDGRYCIDGKWYKVV